MITIIYMGSKRSIAKEIVPIIQSYITEDTKGYIEPFVGGCNIIDKIKCDNRLGYDIHKQLIALFQKLQSNINEIPDEISFEEYQKVKENKDDYEDWYLGLVGFLGSFGAKYFGGYVIYCDPPYKDTTKYSTKGFPYEEFYDWCRVMSKNNIVLISEYSMPNDFKCIWKKESKVNFDSNRKNSDKRIERLFTLNN